LKQPPALNKAPHKRYLWLIFVTIITAGALLAVALLMLFLSEYKAPSLDIGNADTNNVVINSGAILASPHPSHLLDNKAPDTNLNRFIKLSSQGIPIDDDSEWPCVLDSVKQLIWEVKQNDGGWQDHEFTYSWFQSNSETNERISEVNNGKNDNKGNGKEDGGKCYFISCDTHAYIKQMNAHTICGLDSWRLPANKELKSLDHPTNFNPDIDTDFFPQTMLGYYWSRTETANNKSIAMAIDFHNNIGYATEKRLAHFIRAVSSVGVGEK